MSLFKSRDWWSTMVGEGEEFDLGCLCVANIDNSNDMSDKIIVGSFNGLLRIYYPKPSKSPDANVGFRPEDVIVEVQLSQPILQLAAGHFVSGSDHLHLAVLHPRKLSVHSLSVSHGVVEHGNQYVLSLLYEHQLQRTAFNFCYGPFGGTKGRDFICVQSMDGTLSIFEQETLSFARFLPEAVLPGPLVYSSKTDSFITVSAARNVESYKYQVLAVATDAKTKEDAENIKSGKRVAADWKFNLGENAIDIRTVIHHDGTRSILILGERNFFCLTETGKLKFMKKLEYNPCAFCPYMCKEDGTVFTLLATHTKTLMVYRDNMLCWAAQLETVPVQVVRANISDLQGTVITLDDEGRLICQYLGTDPSVSVVAPVSDSREMNYEEQDMEMRGLQRAIKSAAGKDNFTPSIKSEDEITITTVVPPHFDEPSVAIDTYLHDDEATVPSITIKIELKAKAHVTNVFLAVHAPLPLSVTETNFTYDSISPNASIETSVAFYQRENFMPCELTAIAIANYVNMNGAPRIAQCKIRLPLKLVMKACMPIKQAKYKITLDTSQPSINLNDIFPDFLGPNADGPGAVLAFQYYDGPVVTVLSAKSSNRYRVQCDNFEAMWLVTNELCNRLTSHHKAKNVNDFKISYTQALPLEEYFEVVDEHFKVRQNAFQLEELLSQRAAQFRAIQRRLLTRFKDKTPAPLDNLDTLLEGTYYQLLAVADAADENNTMLIKVSGQLSAATFLLNLLIRLWLNLSAAEFYVLQSCITPKVQQSSSQGWEETVDGAITHLLRTSLAKSAKDATLNPAPFAVPQDTKKLKKHLTLMCDRLGKGAKLPTDSVGQDVDTSLPAASPVVKVAKNAPAQKRVTAASVTKDNEYQDDGTKLGDAEVPVGSKFGEIKSPRTKGTKQPVSVALPALDSLRDDQQYSGSGALNLPPIPGMSNQLGQGFQELAKLKRVAEQVPDLDDMRS